MRLIDYLLTLAGPILEFLNGLFMKLAGLLTAVVRMITAIFTYKTRGRIIPEPDSYSRPSRRGLRIFGEILLIVIVAILVIPWAWQSLFGEKEGPLTQDSPEALLKAYYKSIQLKNYPKAWQMLDPRERGELFPRGIRDFQTDWESRRDIHIDQIVQTYKQNFEISYIVNMTWVSQSDQKRRCDKARCRVLQSNGIWVIKYCIQDPHWAPPSNRPCIY